MSVLVCHLLQHSVFALMFCRKGVLSYRNGRRSDHHSYLPYVHYIWYGLCSCDAATVQEDFGQHVKSIVLPKEWTSKTRALFVLLNRLAPAGLQSVTMRSNGSKEWWAGARLAWSGYDNGELFAPIQRLVLDRPNFVSFISLFSKEAPSTRLLLSRMPLTLILSGAPAEEDHEVEWGAGFGGGWAVNPAPAVQWTDEREKMVLRATHLDVEINTGMEQLLDTVFFFDLHSLDVRTRIFSDWALLLRLLRDNRAQLKYLRIRATGSGACQCSFYLPKLNLSQQDMWRRYSLSS